MSARDPLADPEPLIKRVYAYAAYRLGDGPDAEDAVSDAFERALRYRASFDPRRGTASAWMLGIARRCVEEILAARTTLVPEPAGETSVDHDSTLRLDLARALSRLDERDREVIALRYGGDLTAQQIGEQLGMRTNAVEVALHRALGRLRRELDHDGLGAPGRALQPKTAP